MTQSQTSTKRKRTAIGIGDFPRLTRFYGLTPLELLRTPQWILDIYVEQAREIQAEEAMDAITASAWPHMQEKDRNAIVQRLKWRIGVEEQAQKLDVASEPGKRKLAGLGIGLRIDSSEESTTDA